MRSVPMFKNWARSRLDRVVQLLHRKRVKAGTVIIKQGDPPDNVYFVFDGRCVSSIRASHSAFTFRHRPPMHILPDPPDTLVSRSRCVVMKDVIIKSSNRWPSGPKSWTTKVRQTVQPFKVLEMGKGAIFGEKVGLGAQAASKVSHLRPARESLPWTRCWRASDD